MQPLRGCESYHTRGADPLGELCALRRRGESGTGFPMDGMREA